MKSEGFDEYKDFEWAFGLNKFSLRLMGLWPNDDNTMRAPLMILTILLWIFLPQMKALATNIHNLPLVIDNLLTSSAGFTSCVKIFFIWYNKEVMKPVIETVTQDWLRHPKRDWELEIMSKQARWAKTFTLSGYLILGGCFAGFAFAPLAGINIRMISNLTDYADQRFLMVQSDFPFDYSPSPIFELVLICQLIAGGFVGMSVSIPDNYFTALVLHASAQFEILGRDAESFIPEDDLESNRELKLLVDRHVHLLKTVQAIETSFTFVIMAQIFCMTVMVVCLNFQILRMVGISEDKPSPIQLMTLASTLITMLMHCLVDSYASETLASRSSGVFPSIYKSKWFAKPRNNTRDLTLIMAMSKKPRYMTAGKLMNLSLPSYCQILKSAAGYISMLFAVSGR